MTPGARVQAAIEVLERIASGAPAEQALTNWARHSRYAGSKDRAAVRDHVFDCLRRWRSTAAVGGAETGRGRMIGLLRQNGTGPETLFTGDGHAPRPIGPDDAGPVSRLNLAEAMDCPDWLWPLFHQSLGADMETVLEALRSRAPVYLRVNTGKTTLEAAGTALAREGIETEAVKTVATALRVTSGDRKVAGSAAFTEGLIEVQDASSQAACLSLGVRAGDRVLDYCAGGGGKALALAAQGAAVTAHDIDAARMRDIAPRAARAGVTIPVLTTAKLAGQSTFDLVFCDAPCSGSGTWRRAPEAKWKLTPAKLDAFCAVQAEVLSKARHLVTPGGRLAYATCSVFEQENAGLIRRFRSDHPGWTIDLEKTWRPGGDGDGFYLCVLTCS